MNVLGNSTTIHVFVKVILSYQYNFCHMQNSHPTFVLFYNLIHYGVILQTQILILFAYITILYCYTIVITM